MRDIPVVVVVGSASGEKKTTQQVVK